MDSSDLDGRRAVVAGGSKGTGLATARRLRDGGAEVVTIARTQPETVDPLFVQADLSTPEGAASAAAAVAELIGVPDILVHSAGTTNKTSSSPRRSTPAPATATAPPHRSAPH